MVQSADHFYLANIFGGFTWLISLQAAHKCKFMSVVQHAKLLCLNGEREMATALAQFKSKLPACHATKSASRKTNLNNTTRRKKLRFLNSRGITGFQDEDMHPCCAHHLSSNIDIHSPKPVDILAVSYIQVGSLGKCMTS